jgi:hypothetical protein
MDDLIIFEIIPPKPVFEIMGGVELLNQASQASQARDFAYMALIHDMAEDARPCDDPELIRTANLAIKEAVSILKDMGLID